MKFRGKALAAAVALAMSAAFAAGQSADPNTSGPTKNTFRLRVLEPAEGAQITGSSVRVSASTAIPGESSEAQIAATDRTPRPEILVYLDNDQRAVLKGEMNTVTLDNVPAGTHKLVLIAKNTSGEIIDRKEIAFTSVAAAVATSTTTSTAPAAPAPPPPAPVDVAPAPAPVSAPPAAETEMTTTTDEPETLPQTASLLPLAALAGFGLLGAGAALRRRRA